MTDSLDPASCNSLFYNFTFNYITNSTNRIYSYENNYVLIKGTLEVNSATAHCTEWSHSTNDWIIGVPRATGYDTVGYKFLICG